MSASVPAQDRYPAQAIDLLIARLSQISGTVSAIRSTYDDDAHRYLLPPRDMENVLWAVEDMLAQAQDAASQLI